VAVRSTRAAIPWLPVFRARETDQSSGVRGWREGCKDRLARALRGPAGAQGQGSRPQAVSVTGAERSLDTRRCYLQCTGPPKVWLGCACGSQTCDEAAGTRVPRVPAPAGYGNGAALQITALVSGTGSILHDSPERSEVQSGARGVCLRARVRGLAPACWLLQQAGASTQPPVCESQRDQLRWSSPSQSGLS
jgi:hypothetical protein